MLQVNSYKKLLFKYSSQINLSDTFLKGNAPSQPEVWVSLQGMMNFYKFSENSWSIHETIIVVFYIQGRMIRSMIRGLNVFLAGGAGRKGLVRHHWLARDQAVLHGRRLPLTSSVPGRGRWRLPLQSPLPGKGQLRTTSPIYRPR